MCLRLLILLAVCAACGTLCDYTDGAEPCVHDAADYCWFIHCAPEDQTPC